MYSYASYVILYTALIHTQILNVNFGNILMSILQVNKTQMCTHTRCIPLNHLQALNQKQLVLS